MNRRDIIGRIFGVSGAAIAGVNAAASPQNPKKGNPFPLTTVFHVGSVDIVDLSMCTSDANNKNMEKFVVDINQGVQWALEAAQGRKCSLKLAWRNELHYTFNPMKRRGFVSIQVSEEVPA